MNKNLSCRRLLLAAAAEATASFKTWLDDLSFEPMEILQADSFAQARFIQQHDPADLVLVHHELVRREGHQGLAWLTWRRDVPVVFLADEEPRHWQQALQAGVSQCLPLALAQQEPRVLHAALRHALEHGRREIELARMSLQLKETRKHVERLMGMLWRSSPAAAEQSWHSQSALLDRLQEELARADRHHLPLTVVVGQVRAPARDAVHLPDWTVDVIVRAKRRSDVAGQYGPNGFLMLLMHTADKGGEEYCRRLRQEITHEEMKIAGPHRPLHTYFGLASVAGEGVSAANLLRRAEENLEAAMAEKDQVGEAKLPMMPSAPLDSCVFFN